MNRYYMIVTPQAEEQIRDIAYYIAVDLQAPEAAETFLDELQDTFQTISYNPERQFLVEDEPWHSEGIRKIQVKNYMVYFWIDIDAAAVKITGVCYAKRDLKKFLEGMDLNQ